MFYNCIALLICIFVLNFEYDFWIEITRRTAAIILIRMSDQDQHSIINVHWNESFICYLDLPLGIVPNRGHIDVNRRQTGFIEIFPMFSIGFYAPVQFPVSQVSHTVHFKSIDFQIENGHRFDFRDRATINSDGAAFISF